MNHENLTFLLESLKYMGFGDRPELNEQLEHSIGQALPEFNLETEHFFDETCKLETVLYFRRGNRSDMYFFNRYIARLYYPFDQDRNREQTFYISKGRGVTFKEAFNLLQGRAVYKRLINLDGEAYFAWVQLNFDEKDARQNYKTKQFYPQYGYDLEKLLERYPIRELLLPQLRESLIRSLKRGNRHTVTFTKTNKVEKMLIEACPQFKTITIYRPAIRSGQAFADNKDPDWEKVPLESDSGDGILWDPEEESGMPGILQPALEEVNEEEEETSGTEISSPEKAVARKRATHKKIGL